MSLNFELFSTRHIFIRIKTESGGESEVLLKEKAIAIVESLFSSLSHVYLRLEYLDKFESTAIGLCFFPHVLK